MSDGLLLGTVVITKTLAADDILIDVQWTTPDGEDLAMVDALGMIEMAKDTILRSSDQQEDDS